MFEDDFEYIGWPLGEVLSDHEYGFVYLQYADVRILFRIRKESKIAGEMQFPQCKLLAEQFLDHEAADTEQPAYHPIQLMTPVRRMDIFDGMFRDEIPVSQMLNWFMVRCPEGFVKFEIIPNKEAIFYIKSFIEQQFTSNFPGV